MIAVEINLGKDEICQFIEQEICGHLNDRLEPGLPALLSGQDFYAVDPCHDVWMISSGHELETPLSQMLTLKLRIAEDQIHRQDLLIFLGSSSKFSRCCLYARLL